MSVCQYLLYMGTYTYGNERKTLYAYKTKIFFLLIPKALLSVSLTHRTEQHPEISGPSNAAEALGEDMRQLGHVQSLTHVSVMILFFFFSTWKVHLCVPGVPVMPSPIEDPVDSMHGGTRACTVHRLSRLVLVQKYASCIMDFNKFALMY